jgi:hypothetical protein
MNIDFGPFGTCDIIVPMGKRVRIGFIALVLGGCSLLADLDDPPALQADAGTVIDATSLSDASPPETDAMVRQDAATDASTAFCTQYVGAYFCADFESPVARATEQNDRGAQSVETTRSVSPPSSRLFSVQDTLGSTESRLDVPLPSSALKTLSIETQIWFEAPAITSTENNFIFLALQTQNGPLTDSGVRFRLEFNGIVRAEAYNQTQDASNNEYPSVVFEPLAADRWHAFKLEMFNPVGGQSGKVLVTVDGVTKEILNAGGKPFQARASNGQAAWVGINQYAPDGGPVASGKRLRADNLLVQLTTL